MKLAPSEFLSMTPREFKLAMEGHLGERVQSDDELRELLDFIDEED